MISYLNKPLEIKNLSLKNRLVMPPIATSKAEQDGSVSKELLEYYDEKSKGGFISLIIVEHSYILPAGKASEKQLSVSDDNHIEGLAKLARIIHDNGSKGIMQISHAGSATSTETIGHRPMGPSAATNPRRGDPPRELTLEEINDIIEGFRKAALRVQKAGFDGVEIHSAHSYLLNQFFSPLTNRRTDKYGGNLEKRIAIHLEVIKAVREAVGPDYPVLLRLGASDYMEGGATIEDSIIAVQEFEKAGIDIIDISGGVCGYILPDINDQGYFAPLSEKIKEAVSIPVILTGGITEPAFADKLLTDGKADLIGVGRAIVQDSNWAKKAMTSL